MEANRKQQFILTVRRRARQDELYIDASQGKVGYFAGFVTKMLQNKSREMRLAVIQAITGLPLRSFKQLTSSYIEILEEEMKNDQAIVSAIESDCARVFEAEPDGGSPWTLYPWDRPEADVSLLRESD